MKYANKHRKIIAALLKKAEIKKEADIVLAASEYRFEISEAILDARSILGIREVD